MKRLVLLKIIIILIITIIMASSLPASLEQTLHCFWKSLEKWRELFKRKGSLFHFQSDPPSLWKISVSKGRELNPSQPQHFCNHRPCLFIRLGCHNRIPETEWLQQQTRIFSGWSPRPRCPQGWNVSPWLADSCLSLSLRGLFWVCLPQVSLLIRTLVLLG